MRGFVGGGRAPGPVFVKQDGEAAAGHEEVGAGVSAAVAWALNPAGFPEPPEAAALLEPPVRAGLLAPAPPEAGGVTLPEPAEPGGVPSYRWTPHLSWAARSGVRASAAPVVRAVAVIWRADAVLRRGRIQAVLSWLRARRDRFTAAAGPESAVRAAALVDAHIRARMAYPRQIECLPGSAALAVHGWAVGLPARFVIGVHKYPFVAHAWVEHDGQVLNDRAEVARRLAPIVTVGPDRDH